MELLCNIADGIEVKLFPNVELVCNLLLAGAIQSSTDPINAFGITNSPASCVKFCIFSENLFSTSNCENANLGHQEIFAALSSKWQFVQRQKICILMSCSRCNNIFSLFTLMNDKLSALPKALPWIFLFHLRHFCQKSFFFTWKTIFRGKNREECQMKVIGKVLRVCAYRIVRNKNSIPPFQRNSLSCTAVRSFLVWRKNRTKSEKLRGKIRSWSFCLCEWCKVTARVFPYSRFCCVCRKIFNFPLHSQSFPLIQISIFSK